MEDLIRRELNVHSVDLYGRGGGGCINEGQGYKTEAGAIFVKQNSKSGARLMFDGEFESLKAMYATDTIRVPKPMKVVDHPVSGAMLITDFVDISRLSSKCSAEMGTKLAQMHLHNSKLQQSAISNKSKFDGTDHVPIAQFGFHCTTCCGFLPMDNEWMDSWPEFYAQKRLKPQVDRCLEKSNDRDLLDLWSQVERVIPKLFQNVTITPALLHGDLWSGNVGEADGEPVIFDPAAFYGHSEFDFGIARMFGCFSGAFYEAYHKLIPKDRGFDQRKDLYEVFHHLNHWNHFGSSYRSSTMNMLRRIAKC